VTSDGNKVEEFLAKAKEAEEQAASNSSDANVSESWMRVAAAYRELAAVPNRPAA
jgi:hypothetical protein